MCFSGPDATSELRTTKDAIICAELTRELPITAAAVYAERPTLNESVEM